MKKKCLLLVLSLIISACQNIKTREDIENEKLNQIPTALRTDTTNKDSQRIVPDYTSHPPAEVGQNLTNPVVVSKGDPIKIGLILGPGGIRTYAHIGILQELSKAKIPIYSIAGMEMGSLVAAIFSKKGQIYDVEWQMMKLKEDDFFKKNLVLSRGAQDVTGLNNFIQTAIGNLPVEDAKVSFSCPAFNLAKRQIFVMNRGPFTSLLPFCIPYFPFFKPYQQNIAGLTSLVTTVKHLKTKGVNYFIYIDLLNEKSVPFFSKLESEENVIWSMVAQSLDQQLATVHKTVPISLSGFYLDDFSKRREMIQKGQDAGKNLVKELQSELGY